MKSCKILNCRFHSLTLDQTVVEIFELIARGDRGWLCTVNVAVLMMARVDARLQAFIDRAAITVADGQPLVWVSRFRSKQLPERVAGIELVEEICARATKDRLPLYLLGADRKIVESLAVRLRRDHAGLDLIGVEDGYFGADEAPERAKKIADSGAKILIVAMGVPRQEHFIEEQWDNLGVSFAIGVGGSFDVLSGHRMRAPQWVQAIGMEWAYRLMQEPRRLFKRYVVTNTKFLFLIGIGFLFSRRHRTSE
jgi:N-acetylglucosaminyldiphosphoundecaprenol N-acetyl-beta-D-mannosaminyltransferase